MKKLAEQSIKKFIEDKRGKLDKDFKYVNCNTKFSITCEKGHLWKTSWSYINSGRWCPKCATGINEIDIKKFIEDKGGKLDKDWKYITAKTRFYLECDKGHRWKTFWHNLSIGHWCPECAGKIVHEENIREFIKNKKGTLDKNWKYNNSQTKFNLECEKGHHWKTTWARLYNGHWCPECAGKVTHEEDVRKYIERKGGKLEGGWKYISWNTLFDITCEKGHIWKTTWNRLHRHGSWCKECAGMIVHGGDVKKYIEEKGGKLKPGWKYDKSKTKFIITCENNHEFNTCWTYVKANLWCPYCSESKEQKFRKIMEKYFKAKFFHVRPRWLKRRIGRVLELDGYNQKLKIAFEYQGEQHYYPNYKNGNSQKNLEKIQERDAFKVQKCKERGVLLIVVPYWIQEKQWKQFIKEKYQEFICNKLAA